MIKKEMIILKLTSDLRSVIGYFDFEHSASTPKCNDLLITSQRYHVQTPLCVQGRLYITTSCITETKVEQSV